MFARRRLEYYSKKLGVSGEENLISSNIYVEILWRGFYWFCVILRDLLKSELTRDF